MVQIDFSLHGAEKRWSVAEEIEGTTEKRRNATPQMNGFGSSMATTPSAAEEIDQLSSHLDELPPRHSSRRNHGPCPTARARPTAPALLLPDLTDGPMRRRPCSPTAALAPLLLHAAARLLPHAAAPLVGGEVELGAGVVRRRDRRRHKRRRSRAPRFAVGPGGARRGS
ncbi:unnamed protein product [Urochloa humidicola]